MAQEDNIINNNTAIGTTIYTPTDYDFRVVFSLNALKMFIDDYGREQAVKSIGESIISEYERREKENERDV